MPFFVTFLGMEHSFMADYNLWLQKAEDDLRWTNHNLEGCIWYGASFTAQQAAEKALKAYLLFCGGPLRKIHDLVTLVDDCIGLDPSFESMRESASTLTAYYITTRYPIYEDLSAITEKQAR